MAVSTGTVGTGFTNAGTSVVVTVPTVTNGDVLLASIYGRTSTVAYTTPPTGWVLIAQSNTTAVGWQGIYARIASSEPASYTWAGGGSGRHTGQIVQVLGADTSGGASGLIDVVGTVATATATGTTPTIAMPGITPTASATGLFAVIGSNMTVGQTFAAYSSSGFTEATPKPQTTTGGSESDSQTFCKALSSNAATGTITFTTAAPLSSSQGFLFTIKASAPANVAPTAAFTTSTSGLTVTVNGSTSTDSDGTIATWAWNFGDSGTGSGSSTTHTYASAGTYTVTLTVTDNGGATNSTTHSVTVTAPNVAPTCNAGADQTGLEPWSSVTLTGTDSDSDGTIAARAWIKGGVTVATTASYTFSAPGTIAGITETYTYRVTDNGGLTASDTVDVTTLPVTERAAIGGVEVPMQIREN